MKTFYKISGIIFIICPLLLFVFNFKEIKTYKNGIVIDAIVVFVPNCLTTKAHYNFQFRYEGKIYAKQIGVLTCRQLKEGSVIKLKTNANHTVFLYLNENPFKNSVSFFILNLFGLFLIYMGFKRDKTLLPKNTK